MYEYEAAIISVHDGDAMHVEVRIDPGLDLKLNINLTIRLYGLNAPELATAAGKASLAWVQQWLATNAPNGVVILRTIKDHREKYGRYLGIILSPDGQHNLNDDLIAAGQAVVYTVT